MKQRDNNNTGYTPGGITGKGFMPGTSGNPKGRPRKMESITQLVRENLDRVDELCGELNAEVVARTLVKLAKQGNMKAVQILFDRVEGKVPTQMQIETDGPAFNIIFEEGQDGG